MINEVLSIWTFTIPHANTHHADLCSNYTLWQRYLRKDFLLGNTKYILTASTEGPPDSLPKATVLAWDLVSGITEFSVLFISLVNIPGFYKNMCGLSNYNIVFGLHFKPGYQCKVNYWK